MVQVKYGDIVTEMKGKIGGVTFKGGYSAAASQVITKLLKPVSTIHQYRQNQLAYMSALWRGLTDAQRSDWNILGLTWPFVNCFGVVYYGSGYQVFMSVNLNLGLVGTAYHTTAADRVADWVFTGVGGTWTAVPANNEIYFDDIETLGNWRIYLQASDCFSVGQYHKAAKIRYLNEIYNTGGLDHWLWETSWNARFSKVASNLTWQKIMIRIKAINTVSGQHVYADDLFLNSPV
jgi:hypothetical protein